VTERELLGRGPDSPFGAVSVRPARAEDLPEFLRLAGQVEPWFGPMLADPVFSRAVQRQIARGRALACGQPELLGGLLVGVRPPVHHLNWLVVDERARGRGVGRALVEAAIGRFVSVPGTVEVITLGAEHPGAAASGARAFYERLGFRPGEPAPAGPEGGPRQVYRLAVSTR
jgi:ribosomal protein S18 acetylase RimI-like enzyme